MWKTTSRSRFKKIKYTTDCLPSLVKMNIKRRKYKKHSVISIQFKYLCIKILTCFGMTITRTTRLGFCSSTCFILM